MRDKSYTSTAIFLHWLMAGLILAMFLLGWYMTGLPKGAYRTQIFGIHKSLGMTLALIAAARLIWRLGHPAPPLPASMPRWRALLARSNQALLYVFMFFQPATGYLSGVFSGRPVLYFGMALPQWGWKSKGVSEFLAHVHVVSSWILFSLIGLHVLGALTHLFYDRDGVVQRMLPGEREKLPAAPPLRD